MGLAVKCPECTAESEFQLPSSQAVACQLCETVFDREGNRVGRSEPINRAATLFDVGVVGSFEGESFTFLGCVQVRHELGGLWNEWLVVFRDLSTATVVEQQGLLAIVFERDAGSLPKLADVYAFEPGARFLTGSGELTCIERGRAIVAAVKGELPIRAARNTRWFFVDFSTTNGRFASLTLNDPSDETPAAKIIGGQARSFHIGPEVTAAELGLGDRRPEPPETPGGALGTMPCPNCNFAIEKRVGQYDVIVCPQCNTGMTVDAEGQTEVIFKQPTLKHRCPLALNQTVRLDAAFFRKAAGVADRVPWPVDQDMLTVGHVVRSVTVDGTVYFFEEILMSAGSAGFYWMVLTDATWYFARRISIADVETVSGGVRYQGRVYALQERNDATVEQVTGESYYQITVGERTAVADYKSGARMISSEGSSEEIVWTECLEIPLDEVRRVFGAITASSGAGSDGGSGASGVASSTGGKLASLLVWVCVIIFVMWVLGSMCDGAGGGCGGFVGGGGGSFGK